MAMPDIPMYVFTGFLESGKTKFIQETLEDERFNTGERTLLVLVLGGEFLDSLFNGSRRHAQAHEDVHGHAVALFDDADQQVLGRNVGLVVLACHAEGALHHADDERRKGELGSLGLLAGLGNRGLDLFEGIHDVIVGDVERTQCLGGNALVLLGEREQQMLGTHLI